jgi:Na+/melibiose symporter-like transporter
MEIILNMLIILVFAVIYFSHLPMGWQLYGVIISSIGVCFGLYYMLGRRKRIANKKKALSNEDKEEQKPLEETGQNN